MYQSQIYTPPLSPINRKLIIIMVVVFVLEALSANFVNTPLSAYLGLVPNAFLHGHLYQALTFSFVGESLMGLLFNGLVLWFIGSELERLWGRQRYLITLGVCAAGASLFYLLFGLMLYQGQMPLVGMTAVATGLCLGYGLLFPDRTFSIMLMFPIKARVFCYILIGMELYRGFFSPAKSLALGALGSMGCLALYLWMTGNWSPKGGGGGGLRQFWHQRKRDKAKSRLKVISSDRSSQNPDGPPKYWQ